MNKDLKYWLAINKIPNIGPVTIKKLWLHFGSIKTVWEAEESSLREVEGLSKPALRSFIAERDKINLEEELNLLSEREASVLTLDDEGYPKALKNIYGPPPVLYFKGKGLNPNEKALAIVGTRRASHYGKETAKRLAFELASLGITIVSGMALGIDTLAHRGALEAQGKTIAVFGCGVDMIYPPSNRGLAKEIETSGSLVSEFPFETEIEKGNFPRRNRIIAGLSLGTIVVEGHYESGAMITAKYALDEGREVFAVPGDIALDQSKGPHWLIKQGAKLVESVEDVLEELNMVMPKRMINNQIPLTNDGRDYSKLTEDEQKIVSVLSLEPKYIDNIALESALPIPRISSLLMMLEIKKLIRRLPGKLFVLY